MSKSLKVGDVVTVIVGAKKYRCLQCGKPTGKTEFCSNKCRNEYYGYDK